MPNFELNTNTGEHQGVIHGDIDSVMFNFEVCTADATDRTETGKSW